MNWRPTKLEVDLSRIRSNYRAVRKHIGEGPLIFGVVKGDAYKLGALPVAKVLEDEGATFFAVATCDEAIELKEGGIEGPVLVLGPSPYGVAGEYVRLGIRATVNDPQIARAMSDAAVRQGNTAYAHVKVDTGMGRIGFFPDQIKTELEEISKLPGLELEGIFTHFAIADAREDNLDYTREQYRTFCTVLEDLKQSGINFKIRHCCNSGATLALPEYAMDGVRPGQLVVGMYPSKEVVRSIPLDPVFEFKTEIAAIRDVPSGKGISYGLIYYTSSQERLAVIPVGYADGYCRELSGTGVEVLVRGKRCPVVGRICMDQAVVDVSGVPGANVGDEVVLIGRQGDEFISAEEIADRMGTIVTTIPNRIGKRVSRVYID